MRKRTQQKEAVLPKALAAVRGIFTRSVVVYVLIIAVSVCFVDYHIAVVGGNIRESYYRSAKAFIPLARWYHTGKRLSAGKWKEYAYYYDQAVTYTKGSPEAYGMLGLAAYGLGDHKKAADAYAQAMVRAPDVFLYPYHLALVYFRAGHYQLAVEMCVRALAQDPTRTIRFISSSGLIYRPILGAAQLAPRDLYESLRRAYQDCFIIWIMSHYAREEYPLMQKAALAGIASDVGAKAEFYLYAGFAAYAQRNYPEAITFFDESLKMNDTNAEVFGYKGLSLQALGLVDLATEALTKAAQLRRGDSAPVFLDRAYAISARLF